MRVLRLLVAVATLLVVVCGCSGVPALPGWPGWNDVDPQRVSLGEAQVALFISPQTPDFIGQGRVVLIDPDGSHRSVKTSGMDVGGLSWTHRGLWWADTKGAHRLNDSLHSVSGPRPNMQQGIWELPDGTVLSLYNDGWDGKVYLEPVRIDTAESSRQVDAYGRQRVTALCGEALYGVAEVNGPIGAPIVHPAPREPNLRWMITRLAGAREGQGQVLIGSIDMPQAGFSGETVPCRGTTMAFIASPDDERLPTTVVSIDVATGRSISKPLVDEYGHTLAPRGYDVIFGESALDASGLVWFSGDGLVRHTELATGVTRVLWDSGLAQSETIDPRAQITGQEILILERPVDTDLPLRLHRCTLLSGHCKVQQIDGINNLTDIHNIIRGFAVRPT